MTSSPNIDFDDAEIAALMNELEAETTGFEPEKAEIKAKPVELEEKEAEPAPVKAKAVKATKPEPEPEPEPEPIAETPVDKPVETEAVDMAEEPAEDAAISEDRPSTSASPSGLKYFVDVREFNKETKLTEATLDNCMIEQSGLRAWYGAQAANAEAQHDRLKAKFDVLEASLYDHHRKELAASGEKTTEKMVENAVKLDPRWLKGKNAVIESETIANINKALVGSLADRRDMMIQLGADRREEYKGAARVLAERDERESMSARAKSAGASAVRGMQ